MIIVGCMALGGLICGAVVYRLTDPKRVAYRAPKGMWVEGRWEDHS